MQQPFDRESWDSAVWQPANLLPAPEQAGTSIPSDHVAPEQDMTSHFDHESWDSAVWQPANLLSAPEPIGTSIPNDHVVPEQNVTSQFTCSKEPTKADWDRLRPEIEMLYTKHELKDIMAIMRQKYNLRASEKMYKDRRRAWGMSKNIKSKEMEAIVRKTAQRLQAGKGSYFQLRNTWVSEAKIKLYRRAKKILSEQQALALRAPTPFELLCYTPLASPLTTPRELEIPERLLKVVHEYINGSFDSMSWFVQNSGRCWPKKVFAKDGGKNDIFTFNNGIFNAARLFSKGQSQPAWQSLQIAMSIVGRLVSAEDPQTVFGLIDTVLWLCIKYDWPDIALTVLHQFHNMSTKLMGGMHPLSQSSGFLKELVASQDLKPLLKLFQVGIDDFTSRVGELSRDAVQLQLDQAKWSRKFQHKVDSIEALQALLRPFQGINPAGVSCLTIQLRLSRELRYAGRIQEAFEICESLVRLTSDNGYANPGTYEIGYALHEISICHAELGDLASAEQSIHQAVSIEGAIHGFEDELVLSLVAEHVSLLERCEALDEAMRVREFHDRLVASKYEKIFREEEEKWQRFQAMEGGETLRSSSD